MMGIGEGRHCYAVGDADTRDWFHRQWLAWPNRVDERLTTNAAFHYGAAQAYCAAHGESAAASDAFCRVAPVMAGIRGEPCPVAPPERIYIHTPKPKGRRARRRMK